jgi:WD40 repeat protein
VWSVAFSAAGRQLVTSGNDATVRIWHAADTRPPVVLHGFGASVESTVFLSPTRFASTHDDGTVRIWECAACAPVEDILRQADDHATRQLTPEERAIYLNEPPG